MVQIFLSLLAKGRQMIADAINKEAAGVTAIAKLDVTLTDLSSADDGTLTFEKPAGTPLTPMN